MRVLFVLLISFSAVKAQDVLIDKEFTWPLYEKQFSFEEKVSLLKGLDHWVIDFLKSYPFDFKKDEELVNNFHWVDFTGDGHDDIIYYGPAGAEPFTTVLLANLGSIYKEVLATHGVIAELQRSFPFTPYSIKISESICCESPFTCYSSYNLDQAELTYRLENRVCFFDDLEFPNSTHFSKAFKVKNPTYKLRSSPEIIEQTELEQNNVIAIYYDGSEGIALSEKSDSTGRIWWFVAMKNNQGFESSLPYNFAIEKDQFYQLGWMSSRYLEEL